MGQSQVRCQCGIMSKWIPDCHPLCLLVSNFTLCTSEYLLMPFTPAHSFAPTCTQYFPLLLLVSFLPLPPCIFTPNHGPTLSSLYCTFYFNILIKLNIIQISWSILSSFGYNLFNRADFYEMIETKGSLCFDKKIPVVKVVCKFIKNWSRYLG